MDIIEMTFLLFQTCIMLAVCTVPVLAILFMFRRISKSTKKTYHSIRN